jgi:cytochrome bd-type quinol oxidase subunit 2
MQGKALAWLILIALVGAVIGAYLLAWRGRNALARRIGAWIVALLSALAGGVVLVGYAIPTLDDFHNSTVSFRGAFLENLIVWAICAGAWIVAVRFVRRAVRGA